MGMEIDQSELRIDERFAGKRSWGNFIRHGHFAFRSNLTKISRSTVDGLAFSNDQSSFAMTEKNRFDSYGTLRSKYVEREDDVGSWHQITSNARGR